MHPDQQLRRLFGLALACASPLPDKSFDDLIAILRQIEQHVDRLKRERDEYMRYSKPTD